MIRFKNKILFPAAAVTTLVIGGIYFVFYPPAQQNSSRTVSPTVESLEIHVETSSTQKDWAKVSELATRNEVTADSPISSQSLETPTELTESERILLDEWKQLRGYDLIDGFLPSHIAAAHGQGNTHAYALLSVENLEQMAASGDANAQLYYGLNIVRENPDAAVEWLTEAMVNGGYSSPINHIAMVYGGKVIDSYAANAEPIMGRGGVPVVVQDQNKNETPVLSEEELKQNTLEAMKWAMVGALRNDFYAEELLASGFFNDVSKSEQEDTLAAAKELYESLNYKRQTRGLPEFSNTRLPDRISLYFTGTLGSEAENFALESETQEDPS